MSLDIEIYTQAPVDSNFVRITAEKCSGHFGPGSPPIDSPSFFVTSEDAPGYRVETYHNQFGADISSKVHVRVNKFPDIDENLWNAMEFTSTVFDTLKCDMVIVEMIDTPIAVRVAGVVSLLSQCEEAWELHLSK